MAFSVIQQRVDPRELSINITASSGRVFRWGPDESDARNIPSGLSIATQIPGGFATFAATLERQPDLFYYDLDEFAPCTCYGASGALVAFDGYLSAHPMDRSTSYSFTPQAVGWSAHMKDILFSMVYIDRELSTWTGPSTTRQIGLLPSWGVDWFSTQTMVDASGAPSWQISGMAPAPTTEHQINELWYDSGAGNALRYMQYSGITLNSASLNASSWATVISSGADDHTLTSQVDAPSTSASRLDFESPSAGSAGTYRYATITTEYTGLGGGTSGVTSAFLIKNPAVIGNHGLTVRAGPSGSSPGVDDGFYGADIIADIIARACPLLTTGGIAADMNVIPQMAFKSLVTADDAVQQVNQYYLYDYGVYEDREFFWRPPGTGRTWNLRVGDGVTLQDQGPQIETSFNYVVVQFTDAGGTTRFVGPPSFGGDATDASLADTSSNNPVNAYGRSRGSLVQMSSTSTTQGAIKVGQNFLAAVTGRPAQGSATVTGYARDSNGRDWPAWMIRAGDTVVVMDTNDQTPHYVLSTSYSHDSLQNSLTLDAPPNRLDWIMARLGLSISAID